MGRLAARIRHDQRRPRFRQAINLLGFDRMRLGLGWGHGGSVAQEMGK